MSAQLGIVGLGRIGGGLARLALRRGLRVAGYTRGRRPRLGEGFVAAPDLAQLCAALRRPRRIILYVPAGEAIDELLAQLIPQLSPGDVIADGGNSYWGDSIRRAARLRALGLHFLDVGTSGGVAGARAGACFMVGGDEPAVRRFAPVLRRLAVPGGYVHAGGPGSGHFAKLVHNGIEFGMLQAIGEGIALLERAPQKLPVAAILEAWRHGSVIRSWLIDLLAAQIHGRHGLATVPAVVEDTGEVGWLIDDALRLEVPVPVIAQAVMQLLASRDRRGDAARAVAMMRHGFGGHPYGRDRAIARERKSSRIGGFVGGAPVRKARR
jgi:6-phosphogluconate dehydrogenase